MGVCPRDGAVSLVDTLGTFEDAVRITGDLAGIFGEPAIVRERKRESFWESMFGDARETLKNIKQEIVEKPALSYRFTGP